MHTVTANKMDWLLFLYIVKRTGTRRRYMVQIYVAMYLPAVHCLGGQRFL